MGRGYYGHNPASYPFRLLPKYGPRDPLDTPEGGAVVRGHNSKSSWRGRAVRRESAPAQKGGSPPEDYSSSGESSSWASAGAVSASSSAPTRTAHAARLRLDGRPELGTKRA